MKCTRLFDIRKLICGAAQPWQRDKCPPNACAHGSLVLSLDKGEFPRITWETDADLSGCIKKEVRLELYPHGLLFNNRGAEMDRLLG